MDTLRKVLTVGLVLLLTVNVAAANVVVVADRTVLNGEFVKSSLEEEGAYEALQSEVAAQAADQVGDIGGGSGLVSRLPVSVEGVVTDVITREYIETQVEANIDRTYAYLNGEREEFALSVNLTPVQTEAAATVEDRIRALSVADLLDAAAGNRSLSVEVSNVTFDLTVVGQMAQNESAYQDARESFRSDVRTVVLNRAVERAYQETDDDVLLALVIDDYDPTAYTEAEKAQLVQDNEADIKAALRERIRAERGDEINATVDDQLASFNDQLSDEVESAVEEEIAVGGEDVSIAGPVADMAVVAVDGLTTDMPYDTFRTELNASRADLAENASRLVANRLNEQVPSRLDLTQSLPGDARSQLRTARQITGTVNLLVFGLPLLAIALVGLVWFVTRSVPVTAIGGGVALLVSGGASFLAIRQAGTQARRAIESAGQVPLSEVVLGLIQQTVGVATTQSTVIIVLGVLGTVAGVVLVRRAE